MGFDHLKIEKKWQDLWEEDQVFQASEGDEKPKYYVLDMFPYPSGHGLHVGHMASYTPSDVMARYKRAKGFNVLHPMGYDAFGLPAEQYAIQTGIHPAETTQKAISNFRRQLKEFGFSFDWSREISTADPSYYKWTQFIFTKLFEKGLAYQKEAPVNWCPALKTVLANDEVVDGKSERGGHPVERIMMKQWMLKITDYAERLLEGLDGLDWPERTKEGQRNWIGKSEGAEIQFPVENQKAQLEVFTTRPDTLFGVTFMVLSPEHPLVAELTAEDQKEAVESYVQKASRKSEVDRKAAKDKTGVFTGSYALHPLTQKKIPLWVADYVLMDYGTGAIMAVPGHDARDYEFAKTHNLPIVRVLGEDTDELPFEGEGKVVNSDFLNGLKKDEAIEKALSHLEKNNLGLRKVQYKLRDWLFSRQRYWGEPFPLVHFEDGATEALPVEELPVELPEVANYEPSDQGEPPLARATQWVKYEKDSRQGKRETDTMPGSAGSSWYFLRFTDPLNPDQPFDFSKQAYWMPVDLYVGGPEHTVGHLLYARFWQKFLFDLGLTSHDEPFKKLAHQGMILGLDGEKMSKSRGNTINPDDIRTEYGSDTLRCYILFLGPMDRDKPWSPQGIEGVRRFLERVERLFETKPQDTPPSAELYQLWNKTLKKVSEDIESLNHNTAISAMMILVNELYKSGERPLSVLKGLAQILAPFAPHLSEELWTRCGEAPYVANAPWPQVDPKALAEEKITMAVQINGKTKGTIAVQDSTPEEEAILLAKELKPVQVALQKQELVKVIYRPGRILNLVVR